jgi:hypothetical protein
VDKIDSTRNQRQARRREREKEWLEQHGWRSWEALHTSLMKGEVDLVPIPANESSNPGGLRIPYTTSQQ